MKITQITHENLPEADDILCSAFESNCSMMADLHRLLQIEPGGYLLGYYKDIPAGTVGAVNYGRFAYLGMMAVTRATQHRGIGRILLEEILARLDNKGISTILLDATLSGKPLYLRAGFQIDDQVRQFVRHKTTVFPTPSDHIRLMTSADIATVAEADQPIFGTRRERVLAAFLEDFPERAFVNEKNGQIAGFLIAQEQRIGPWTAHSLEAAQALLGAALHLPFGAAPKVLIPTKNQAGAAMLVRHGFVLQNTLDHMRRGGESNPIQRTQIYGQASFALG
jgi:GNAT superfamily N-acetyltransferase